MCHVESVVVFDNLLTCVMLSLSSYLTSSSHVVFMDDTGMSRRSRSLDCRIRADRRQHSLHHGPRPGQSWC